MSRVHRLTIVSLLMLTLPVVSTAEAQGAAQTRAGFWFSAGPAWGSLGCDGCNARVEALSASVSVGATLSPLMLVGVGLAGWSKSEDGASLQVSMIDARLRFYLSETGSFFFTAGGGLGSISAELVGVGSDSQVGLGLLGGMGYDIGFDRGMSATPFVQWFMVKTQDADANVVQFGLSITTH